MNVNTRFLSNQDINLGISKDMKYQLVLTLYSMKRNQIQTHE